MRDLVARRDDGAQLGGGQVLYLVDEQPDGGVSIRRRLRHRDQETRQVLLQNAGVSFAGREIDAQLQITGGHLEGSGEVRQNARGPTQAMTCRLSQVESVDRAPKLRGQQLRKRAALGRLDPHRAVPLLVRKCTQAVQQDSLADTSQPEQYQTLGRASVQHAVHVDGSVRQEAIPTGQLRRLETGSRNERVAATIHGGNLAQILRR